MQDQIINQGQSSVATTSISNSITPPLGSYSITDGLNFIFDYLGGFSIEIENRSNVNDFLFNHPSIISNLYSLPEQLQPFCQDSKFSLDVRFDETDSGTEPTELRFVITTTKTVAETVNILDDIQKKWLYQIDDPNMSLFFFYPKFDA